MTKKRSWTQLAREIDIAGRIVRPISPRWNRLSGCSPAPRVQSWLIGDDEKEELDSAGSGDRYCGADSAPDIAEVEQAIGMLASTPRSELAVIDMTSEWRRPYSFVGLIGGRWTLVLLAKLAAGGRRYQDLHGALDRKSVV